MAGLTSELAELLTYYMNTMLKLNLVDDFKLVYTLWREKCWRIIVELDKDKP